MNMSHANHHHASSSTSQTLFNTCSSQRSPQCWIFASPSKMVASKTLSTLKKATSITIFNHCTHIFRKATPTPVVRACIFLSYRLGPCRYRVPTTRLQKRLYGFVSLAIVFTLLLLIHQWTTMDSNQMSMWERESKKIIRGLRSVQPDLSEMIGGAINGLVIVQNVTKPYVPFEVQNISQRPIFPSQQMDEYLLESLDWSHESRGCDTPPCNTSWCPAVPFEWRSCNVTFNTYFSGAQGNSSKRPHHWVELQVGYRHVATWSAHDGIYLALLHQNCTVHVVKEFGLIKQAALFIDTIPSFTIVAGLTSGVNGKLLPWKFGYKIKMKFRNYFFPFVLRKGYAGLGNYNMQHTSVVSNYSWSRPVYFGVRWAINKTDFPFEELPTHVSGMKAGHWSPESCKARWRLAIVLPYRAREKHLRLYIRNMAFFLQKQRIDFSIFVIEQTGDTAFNRAALMNIGFVEAMKLGHFDCFAFHDVDLIPEDFTNLYACSKMPRHLVAGRDHYRYILRYPEYFGGAVMLQPHHIVAMNGFTNKFFGWGGEDDNAYMRVRAANLTVTRFPQDIARYTMMRHGHDSWNPRMKRSFPFRWRHNKDPNTKFETLEKETAQGIKHSKVKNITDVWSEEFQAKVDGLHTMNYTLKSIVDRTFFIHVSVEMPGPKISDMLCLNSTRAELTPDDRGKLCNLTLPHQEESEEFYDGEGQDMAVLAPNMDDNKP